MFAALFDLYLGHP